MLLFLLLQPPELYFTQLRHHPNLALIFQTTTILSLQTKAGPSRLQSPMSHPSRDGPPLQLDLTLDPARKVYLHCRKEATRRA